MLDGKKFKGKILAFLRGAGDAGLRRG